VATWPGRSASVCRAWWWGRAASAPRPIRRPPCITHYAPAPVYRVAPPVYYGPPPVVYGPPVYYTPRRYWRRGHWEHRGRHGHR